MRFKQEKDTVLKCLFQVSHVERDKDTALRLLSQVRHLGEGKDTDFSFKFEMQERKKIKTQYIDFSLGIKMFSTEQDKHGGV